MSKLSGETLREGITTLLTQSQEKQRKFTETIELQASFTAAFYVNSFGLEMFVGVLLPRLKNQIKTQ